MLSGTIDCSAKGVPGGRARPSAACQSPWSIKCDGLNRKKGLQLTLLLVCSIVVEGDIRLSESGKSTMSVNGVRYIGRLLNEFHTPNYAYNLRLEVRGGEEANLEERGQIAILDDRLLLCSEQCDRFYRIVVLAEL